MTAHRMEPPVKEYAEMAGWPGCIPPRRLRNAVAAIEARMPEELQDQQTRDDVLGLLQAHHANFFPQDPVQDPLGVRTKRLLDAVQDWNGMLQIAWSATSSSSTTIGGILTWKKTKSNDWIIFKMLRDPEIMGMHQALPLMQDMWAVILESPAETGRPGLIIAEDFRENFREDFDERSGTSIPPGEAENLARILRWHGAQETRWVQHGAT